MVQVPQVLQVVQVPQGPVGVPRVVEGAGVAEVDLVQVDLSGAVGIRCGVQCHGGTVTLTERSFKG